MFANLIDVISSRFPESIQEIENGAIANPAINAFVIDKLASSTAPRPHAFSLASDYTSWKSLTDRSFTGRHLPIADQAYMDFLKTVDAGQLSGLFQRPKGNMVPCSHSSAMFPAFAQWFTDGFLRTDLQDPRKNTSNHEIDLCQIYGLNAAVTDQLRLKKGGRLKSQVINGEEFPPYAFENGQKKPEFSLVNLWGPANTTMPLALSPEETQKRQSLLFAMGTDRSNSTLGYAMINTLFLREHNRVADILAQANPAWDDERIFQVARNVMIVLLIKIVIEDYIAHIAGINLKADPTIACNKPWYRTNWMTLEFDLLYRWHSLTPDDFNTPAGRVEYKDYMYNNPMLTDHGIGKAFAALSAQKAGQIGLGNTPYFLYPIEKMNIGYARTFRLRSYNEYRSCFGLHQARDFSDITRNETIQQKLQDFYKTVDNVEWYVGMYAEDRSPLAMMGELQTTMVANDAFSQALTNPLLSAHVFNKQTFSAEGWDIINETSTLDQLLQRNTQAKDHCSFKYS